MDLADLGYSFQANFFKRGAAKLHFVDEGSGDVILMLHGNPTWSFFYRNLISHFSKTHRVIAPDHMGCGFSDQPKDYPYTLKQRVEDISSLLQELKIKKFKLIVHDWGGAIGFGVATSGEFDIEKIVILNTAAFTSTYIPWQISMVKKKPWGPLAIKYLNAFCFPATFMTTQIKLSHAVKKAYLYPYRDSTKRRAVNEFVQDIPLSPKHPSFTYLSQIEQKLNTLEASVLALWGKKDFCFNDYFLKRWKQIYPKARFVEFENAGHYVLEDKPLESQQLIEEFFRS